MSYATIVRRHLWLILLVGIGTATVALGASALQAKRYESTAALLFHPVQVDQAVLAIRGQTSAPSEPYRDAATNLQLVSLEAIARLTAARLGTTTANVRSNVSIEAKGQSDVVAVTAGASSASGAARLANGYANAFIESRRAADRASILETRRLVQLQIGRLPPAQRQGPTARTLAERANQLARLAALQTGNAELVQQALPPRSARSPSPVRNGLLGGILGLLAGFLIAVVLERTDRRVRDADEAEAVAGIPTLGAIAKSRRLRQTGRAPAAELEPFRLLYANLRYWDADPPIRSVLVTSPSAGDGKSLVASNLAAAVASTGSSVLLIEADFRQPVLARRYELRPEPGVRSILAGEVSLEGAVQVVRVGRGESNNQYMDVVVAGTSSRAPIDLFNSDQVGLLVHDAIARYDLVVVDSPSMATTADAIPLVRHTRGVVVVARPGHTQARSLDRLCAQIANMDPAMLALVITGVDEAQAQVHLGELRGSRA